MTFPTIPTVGDGRVLTTTTGTASTTHTFPNLSSLTKNAGDLLVAIICQYQGGATDAEYSSWGASFVEFVDQADTGTGAGAIGAASKVSTGSETGTFNVTSVGSFRSCQILLSIPGAHDTTAPEGGVKADGTGAAADPLSFNPAGWDAEDTLWIAVGCSQETSITGSFTGLAAAPTNYTNYADTGIAGTDAVGACEGAVAFRQLNAASEDAGGFSVDITNAANSGLLIAVRPAAVVIPPGPGPGLPNLDYLVDNPVFFPFDTIGSRGAAFVGGPVRFFDGVDDVIQLTPGTAATLGSAFTVLAAVEILNFADGSPFFLGIDGSQTPRLALEVGPFNNGTFFCHVDGQAKTLHNNSAGLGWVIFGATKAAGSNLVRAHRFTFNTGTWSHFNASGATVDAANTGSALFIGRFGNTGSAFLHANVAGVAAWDRELNDTEIETLKTGLQAWFDATPVGLWRPSDVPVNDYLGTSDQSAITGTEVVTNTAPPNFDLSIVTGGAQTIPIGQVVETETAQAVTASRTLVVGQATETEAAQAVSLTKTAAAAQAVETETSQPVASIKTVSIGQATETESAQPVVAARAAVTGQVVETETAQSTSTRKTVQLGQVVETEIAQAITAAHPIAIGQVSETETVQPVTVRKLANVGQPVEVETAQQMLTSPPTVLGQVAEIEAAQPVTVRKTQRAEQPVEVEMPLLYAEGYEPGYGVPYITVRKEVDSAQPVETETVQPVKIIRQILLSQVTEIEIAIPIIPPTPPTLVVLGQVIETEFALSMTPGNPHDFWRPMPGSGIDPFDPDAGGGFDPYAATSNGHFDPFVPVAG